jgi:hypothetical protein
MASRYLRQYCPSAKPVMRADLPNFRVEFRRFSTDMQGGISSIMEAPGEMVRGVIYEVPVQEVKALDILEDLPKGLYRRDTFLVLGEDGQWHQADLYRVVNPTGPYDPAPQYIDMMIEGAREHDLDPTYIDHLESLRTNLT